MPDKIMVKLFRFNPSCDKKPKYDVFEIPATEPTTILILLKYIRSNLDPTIAFRDYICYKGICANCMVKFNGKAVRSCSTRVNPGQELTLEPLSNHPVIRDLVVDFGTPTEGDQASYIIRKGALIDIMKK